MGYHVISWDVMGYHGISWDIMGYHGISWDIMGYHGISCDFLGLSSPFVIFQLFGKIFAFPIFWGLSSPNCLRFLSWMFLCFLSFCGLSSPDCIGFGVYWSVCFRFFLGFPAHSSPKLLEGISSLQILEGLFPKKSWREYPAYRSPKILEGISSLQIPKNLEGLFTQKSWREYPAYRSWRDCSPKTPGGNIQPTDPGGTVPQKILEGISSLQILKKLEGMFPKKSWRDYPVHSSQKTAGTIQSTLPKKNPGRTIQSTVPKKTLEGLSSPQFPKKPCRDYPVHNSQKKTCRHHPVHTSPKKSWRDYPVHSSQKNPRDYPVHSSQKNPAGTIQSTLPKKILEGLSSPQFPKKNPDAFSPSAGLRFAKPSLHRSVPGILPAVLVPAVFFLASQPGSLKKRLSSQKLGRLSKAKGQSLPIWLSAHTFSKSPYCYRTSASCSLALSHLSASCCGPQSWSSGIFCRDQSQFWGAALQTSHPLDVRLQKKKVCFQGFPAHFDSKNSPTLRFGLSSPFGLKNQP